MIKKININILSESIPNKFVYKNAYLKECHEPSNYSNE